MSDIKHRLEYYQIEWDGPIVFVKDDSVTILSPFQIISRIENTSLKVKTAIYRKLGGLTTRDELLALLERIGVRLLSIKL